MALPVIQTIFFLLLQNINALLQAAATVTAPILQKSALSCRKADLPETK